MQSFSWVSSIPRHRFQWLHSEVLVALASIRWKFLEPFTLSGVKSPTCKATQSRRLWRLRRLRPPNVARIITENVWSFYLLEELPPALWACHEGSHSCDQPPGRWAKQHGSLTRSSEKSFYQNPTLGTSHRSRGLIPGDVIRRAQAGPVFLPTVGTVGAFTKWIHRKFMFFAMEKICPPKTIKNPTSWPQSHLCSGCSKPHQMKIHEVKDVVGSKLNEWPRRNIPKHKLWTLKLGWFSGSPRSGLVRMVRLLCRSLHGLAWMDSKWACLTGAKALMGQVP